MIKRFLTQLVIVIGLLFLGAVVIAGTAALIVGINVLLYEYVDYILPPP